MSLLRPLYYSLLLLPGSFCSFTPSTHALRSLPTTLAGHTTNLGGALKLRVVKSPLPDSAQRVAVIRQFAGAKRG